MVKVRNCIKYDDIFKREGHYNVMHNKSVYEVDYPDGMKEQLSSNIIAENILSQVYSEFHHYQMLTEVTNQQRYYRAITKVDGFIKFRNGNLHHKMTTLGWKLLVRCNYGSVDWAP